MTANTAPRLDLRPGLLPYRAIVDDIDALNAALNTKRPATVHVNTDRIAPAALTEAFRAGGWDAEGLRWLPSGIKLGDTGWPGRHWTYRAGLYQVQEEASMMPVALLAPQPGDRVLDLCAAPGNKTAQIALAVGRTGTTIANDRDAHRLGVVRDTALRLGLDRIVSMVHDGATFPLPAGPFDRVLVDAPCTSEGSSKVSRDPDRLVDQGYRRWVIGQQKALLRRAIDLCRPGGRVVYSTCTFCPDENEGVVAAILAEIGDRARLAHVELPGLAVSPGLTSLPTDGETPSLPPELAHTIRLWPHIAGTGGFFAAAIDVIAPSDKRTATNAPRHRPVIHDDGQNALRAAYQDIFGLPDAVFAKTALVNKGDAIVMVSKTIQAPSHPVPATYGLPLARSRGNAPKMTTAAAMVLGPHATRNAIDLTAAQRDAFHAREEVTLDPGQMPDAPKSRMVILRYGGLGLGIGFLDRNGAPVVESQFPRIWASRKARIR